ncbi:MAG: HD domain-containing protein [Spirochaetota bacterium]
MQECPGAKKLKQPFPEIVACPDCGGEVEIWSDELRASCPECGTTVTRYQEMSCLEWCEMARECVGEKAYNRYMTNRAVTLKQKLLEEMVNFYGDERKWVDHTREVLSYAEEILKTEQGDWYIVVPAAILHDVGIKIAQQKYGSYAGPLQEKEGPPVARKILLKVGLNMESIDEICSIIAHHHSPGKIKTKNFSILYDADWLVNLRDEYNVKDRKKLSGIIAKVFLTETGRKLARKMYLEQ